MASYVKSAWLLVGCACFSLSLAAGERSLSVNSKAQNYALLVGVSHGLPAIDIDLNTMEAMDTNPAYNFSNLQLLDEKGTQAEVLRELEHQSSRVDEEGTFLFYYSGHGEPGLLVLEDLNTKVDKLRGAIQAGRNGLSPLARLVVILDSCFSGSLLDPFNVLSMRFIDEKTYSERLASSITAAFSADRDNEYWKSLFVFASSRANETSLGGMNGSEFTVALKKAFDETLAAKGTMATWVELTKKYTKVHHPVERFVPTAMADELLAP